MGITFDGRFRLILFQEPNVDEKDLNESIYPPLIQRGKWSVRTERVGTVKVLWETTDSQARFIC